MHCNNKINVLFSNSHNRNIFTGRADPGILEGWGGGGGGGGVGVGWGWGWGAGGVPRKGKSVRLSN